LKIAKHTGKYFDAFPDINCQSLADFSITKKSDSQEPPVMEWLRKRRFARFSARFQISRQKIWRLPDFVCGEISLASLSLSPFTATMEPFLFASPKHCSPANIVCLSVLPSSFCVNNNVLWK
jgi:hypothetical protein